MMEYQVLYTPGDKSVKLASRVLIAETHENAIEGFYLLYPNDIIYCVLQRVWENPSYFEELGA